MTGDLVQQHYGRLGIADDILAALDADAIAGFSAEELASFDELHSRAREATGELAALAELRPGMHLLDVGSGLGGPARHLALAFGVRVTGIELTADYVRVARILTARAGLADRVAFEAGNALSAPFMMGAFDGAWLQHMVMNVADKARLFAELRRVLAPGGLLVVHEIVAPDGYRLRYPLPWARTPATSFVPRPERLQTTLATAGFAGRVWQDTTPLAAAWYRAILDCPGDDPRLLGLHTLLGPDALPMIENLAEHLEAGHLGVVMGVFAKAG